MDEFIIQKKGKWARGTRRRQSTGPNSGAPARDSTGGKLLNPSEPEAGPEISESTKDRQAEETIDRRERFTRITLGNQSLQTLFQPIVDIRTGGTVGAEALTRFNVPPFRPPDLWFSEAAELGLGTDLEVRALRSAFEQLVSLPTGLYLSSTRSRHDRFTRIPILRQ